jgi:hypothetical protein
MRKSLLFAALAAIVTVAICCVAPQGASAKGNNPQNDTYMVVQVMTSFRNSDGKTEYKKDYTVIAVKTLRDKQKEAKDSYDKALKLWNDERKTDPAAPRPVKWVPKKIGPTFETQQGAQEYSDKLKEEDKKAAEK